MNAITGDRLIAADWTTLDITAGNMELVLDDATVMAGMFIGPPVFLLAPIPYAFT